MVRRARLYPPVRVLPLSCQNFTWDTGEHVFECYRRTDAHVYMRIVSLNPSGGSHKPRRTQENKQVAHLVALGLSKAFEPSAPEGKSTYHLVDAQHQVDVGKVGEHWLGM